MKKNILFVFLIILSLCLCDIQNLLAQSDTSLPDLITYRKGDKWGYCLPVQSGDQKKEIIISCKYDDAGFFIEGLVAVNLYGEWGFIDNKDKIVIPFKYNNAWGFSEGLAIVCMGEFPSYKYGFVDKNSKEVIPLKYDVVLDFHEGLAVVELNKKRGFVDKEGKEYSFKI